MSDLIIKSIITKLQSEISKLEQRKEQLSIKFTSTKIKLFTNMIRLKCKSQLKSFDPYGEVFLLENGSVSLELNKEYDNDDERVKEVVGRFNDCYLLNSFNIGSIDEEFGMSVEENMRITNEMLSSCRKEFDMDRSEVMFEDCVEKGVRFGIKDYYGIIARFSSKLDSIDRMII